MPQRHRPHQGASLGRRRWHQVTGEAALQEGVGRFLGANDYRGPHSERRNGCLVQSGYDTHFKLPLQLLQHVQRLKNLACLESITTDHHLSSYWWNPSPFPHKTCSCYNWLFGLVIITHHALCTEDLWFSFSNKYRVTLVRFYSTWLVSSWCTRLNGHIMVAPMPVEVQ